MIFRMHKGTKVESMASQVEVSTMDELKHHIENIYEMEVDSFRFKSVGGEYLVTHKFSGQTEFYVAGYINQIPN